MASKRPRLDRTTMLVLDAGIAATGLSAVMLGLALVGGYDVQVPAYAVLSVLWHALLVCIAVELVCLIWAMYLVITSPRRRPPHVEIIKVFAKSVCFLVLLHLLMRTKMVWVENLQVIFLQELVISTHVYVLGRPYRMTAAQGLGVGTLLFGSIIMAWTGFVVVPLVRRVVRPASLRQTVKERIRRKTTERRRKTGETEGDTED